MIRKTMRVGEVRTSIKLEPAFWAYLTDPWPTSGAIRPSALVNQVAAATPDRTNLASTLRTFALSQATWSASRPSSARSTGWCWPAAQDLIRVLEACPLPCLVLDRERKIRQLNRAFATWLNLEPGARSGRGSTIS